MAGDPADRSFDVIVLGLGPGGEDVAGRLAEAGLSVLGVEHRLVGGECPYWGCIPSKTMVRAADLLAEAHRVNGLAGSVEAPRPDWSLVSQRVRKTTADWNDRAAIDRFTGKGGTFVRGHGRVRARGQVEVDGVTYRARRGIVVATGSSPFVPPIEGLDDVEVWTNRQFIEATKLPGSLLVLGGGAIGCELGQVAARFGVRVTMLEAGDRLLSAEEPDASALIERVLRDEGMDVRTEAKVTRVQPDGSAGETIVTLGDGATVRADRLLIATGRHVDVHAVGLDALGVDGLDASAHAVPIDEWCRVTDGIWALGDATRKGAFTHTAMYQAGIVVRDLLGQGGPPASYEAMPRVTYTDPEVGAVGLTEREAREKHSAVRVGTVDLASSSRGWIHQAKGFITVIEDAERGVLVGATSVGPTGGEVLGLLTLAVHARVPVSTLRSMLYAFPTFHRAVLEAVRALK